MILSPEEYSSASTEELLHNAERGYVGVDHRFLRAIFARGESVLPDFVGFLKKELDENERVHLDGPLIDMARHLRTPAALPFLAECARSYDYSLHDELTEAFVDLGAASIDTLIELYEESDHASDVLFTLAGLGAKDQRILDLLTAHFAVDPADATAMLGLYGDPGAKPLLAKALEDAQGDERLQQELKMAICDLERADETHPDAFDIFPDYEAEEPPFFAAFDNPELLEFLKSPVADYRVRALRMLAFDELPQEIVQRVFETAQQDSDPHVRGTAWESLEGVHEPPEIEEALRKKLADADAPMVERAGALVALAHESGDDAGIRGCILEFYGTPEVRAQAVRAMWHSADRRFELAVVKALDEPQLDVQLQAITAVGTFGLVSQLGKLERLFEHDDLRDSALFAYALAAPAQSTPAHLRKLFRRIEDLAGGLNEDELMLVGKALDDRLEANGYDPFFLAQEADEDEGEDPEQGEPTAVAPPAKVGRNDPCPCGSGKKYKKCCGK